MALLPASAYVVPADVNAPGATPTQLQNACDDACATADSYIQKKHQLPLLQWGADLRGACRRMARYNALADRGFDPSNPADQAVVMANKDAIAWLKEIARSDGDAELVGCIDSSPNVEEEAPLHCGDEPHRWEWGTRREGVYSNGEGD